METQNLPLESLPAACTEATPVPGHEPSLLPSGRNFTLAWHDEFDGTELDRTKWDYRLAMMQKRHPAWTDRAGRRVGKGHAVFDIRIEDGRPVTSQLQSGYNFMDAPYSETLCNGSDHLQWPIGKLHEPLFEHAFGYWECRCRLQQMPGWWSAFWIQSPTIGASLDPARTGVEIDVMESFKPGICHVHNLFQGGYGKDNMRTTAGYDLPLDKTVFHRFGVLWEETGYTFYVDGREHGRIEGHVSRVPEFVLVSTEVKGYRHADHQPVKEAFEAAAAGDAFLVDYVRVFDEVR